MPVAMSTLRPMVGKSASTTTLLIQRAEHRDTQAIHAKLDELLSADQRARTAVAHVDDKEPEEIERFRKQERADH